MVEDPEGTEAGNASGRDRRTIGIAALIAVVLIGGLAAAVLGPWNESPPASRALTTLSSESSFDAADDAGASFARVASALLEQGSKCRDRLGDVPRCQAWFAAGAFAQAFAVEALTCSQAGIHEAREALATYVRAVEDVPQGAERAPQPPAIPSC